MEDEIWPAVFGSRLQRQGSLRPAKSESSGDGDESSGEGEESSGEGVGSLSSLDRRILL
jgi:hypothetical protein